MDQKRTSRDAKPAVKTRRTNCPSILLEPRPLDPVLRFGVNPDPSLVNLTRSLKLVVPQLELDVGLPRPVVRLPLDPAFKDLPRSSNVLEQLLQLDELEPKPIHSR